MKYLVLKQFNRMKEAFIKRGINLNNDLSFLVLERFKNDILNDIKKEENIVFNPMNAHNCFEHLGSTYFEDKLCDTHKLFLDNYKYQNGVYNDLIIYQDENNLYTLVLTNFEDDDLVLVRDIKIPNHRQGVELLFNLDVIWNEKNSTNFSGI